MFELFGWGFLSLHYILLLVLCLFGLHRLSMVFRWYKYKDKTSMNTDEFTTLPTVTIQIPVYNERNVIGRIIDQTVLMDYPSERLQIQVVDDSTDDTFDLIAALVKNYQHKGVDIQHVHRRNRVGFKAGALREAMDFATGEFIAIFDADFMPPTDFLQKTIHQFSNPKLAMLQARWGHLNLESNRLTRTQAMMLDSHFALEQQVRYGSDMLFNFNGTAGIWRVEAIIDAGHWSADTLTEDLDLSYRAQLRGWQMIYVNDIECAAELPSNMRAFKSQQHRWAKGGIQVMQKMLGRVWHSDFSLAKKVESTFHLSNNFAYFVMLVDTLFLLIPSLLMRQYLDMPILFWLDIPLLMLSSGSHLIYLYFGQVALKKTKLNALIHLPSLLLLGINLAFNNARAALEALRGQESEFVRTPKNGELLSEEGLELPHKLTNYKASLPAEDGLQILTSAVFIFAAGWVVANGNWYMLPFLLLLALGFSMSAIDSYNERKKSII